ncbi:putative DNA polymerase lambda [Paratrimastix pyriformis]|uniref:DNA polymerase lambda n=1 Tax=Paratrimastix pyriformis TaxID=342808 RepID=A0ABQ8UHL8_9EUKA|nr:putative DNA polymerase lambda [Paratrimastix pyriformis]
MLSLEMGQAQAHFLEKKVIDRGGRFFFREPPGPSVSITHICTASSSAGAIAHCIRRDSVFRGGTLSLGTTTPIVRYEWLTECIAADAISPPLPRHLVVVSLSEEECSPAFVPPPDPRVTAALAAKLSDRRDEMRPVSCPFTPHRPTTLQPAPACASGGPKVAEVKAPAVPEAQKPLSSRARRCCDDAATGVVVGASWEPVPSPPEPRPPTARRPPEPAKCPATTTTSPLLGAAAPPVGRVGSPPPSPLRLSSSCSCSCPCSGTGPTDQILSSASVVSASLSSPAPPAPPTLAAPPPVHVPAAPTGIGSPTRPAPIPAAAEGPSPQIGCPSPLLGHSPSPGAPPAGEEPLTIPETPTDALEPPTATVGDAPPPDRGPMAAAGIGGAGAACALSCVRPPPETHSGDEAGDDDARPGDEGRTLPATDLDTSLSSAASSGAGRSRLALVLEENSPPGALDTPPGASALDDDQDAVQPPAAPPGPRSRSTTGPPPSPELPLGKQALDTRLPCSPSRRCKTEDGSPGFVPEPCAAAAPVPPPPAATSGGTPPPSGTPSPATGGAEPTRPVLERVALVVLPAPESSSESDPEYRRFHHHGAAPARHRGWHRGGLAGRRWGIGRGSSVAPGKTDGPSSCCPDEKKPTGAGGGGGGAYADLQAIQEAAERKYLPFAFRPDMVKFAFGAPPGSIKPCDSPQAKAPGGGAEEGAEGQAPSPSCGRKKRRVAAERFACQRLTPGQPGIGAENPNRAAIEILGRMGENYQATGDNWRGYAYRKVASLNRPAARRRGRAGAERPWFTACGGIVGGWDDWAPVQAVTALKNTLTPVTTVAQAARLPGVGLKMAEKIAEIAATGRLERYEKQVGDDFLQTVQLFSGIWGAGPATCKKWYSMGCRTLDDVRERGNPTKNQQVGLRYYHELAQRIPREEATRLIAAVRRAIDEIDPQLELVRPLPYLIPPPPHPLTPGFGLLQVCCGSYRRGRSDCGDVDMLITSPDTRSHRHVLPLIIAKLKGCGFLTDDLALHGSEKWDRRGGSTVSADPGEVAQRSFGATSSEDDTDNENEDSRYMGVCQLPGGLHRRIDMKVYPLSEFPFAVLYFTGSGYFNRSMRLLAKKKGFSLSDRHIVPRVGGMKGSPIPCATERDIFEVLGMEYRTPEERNL